MIGSKSPAVCLIVRLRHPSTARNYTGERAMSSAVYAGGRSNKSPSPDLKSVLEGVTLMLALLALNACEMFVVRILRDRPTPTRCPGEGKGEGSRAVAV